MYTTNFNPALDAKSTPKERFVWMLYMGIVFFLLYGSANHYASLHAPHPSFFMAWEEEIPFIPSFIIPYISSDLLFCIAFLLPYTRLELRILALRVFFIISFSVLCFVLFPLQFSFTKPQSESLVFYSASCKPIFHLTNFPRYISALLSFCMPRCSSTFPIGQKFL